MTQQVDVAIIGAGPAGMSLAHSLTSGAEAASPLRVLVIDEQQDAGGQVYRGALHQPEALARLLGREYQEARGWLGEVRQNPNIEFRFEASVWNIEQRKDCVELTFLQAGKSQTLRAKQVVLASGALERPTPFLGWQLPGVMTMGAAQTLMKQSGLVPDKPLVLLGSAPLLYLFAKQLLKSGVAIEAILHTAPRHVRKQAVGPLLTALSGNGAPLAKGLLWRLQLALAGVRQIFGVEEVAAVAAADHANGELAALRYRRGANWQELACGLALVHDGVVPNTHLAAACGCELEWDEAQACWRPQRTTEGRSSQERIWLVGDGARILGAAAARWQAIAMAPALLEALSVKPSADLKRQSRTAKRKLASFGRLRRFLDAQFLPAKAFSKISDDTQICRCEAVSAGEVRRIAALGCSGVNQARSFTRAGMGPCMGRQCGSSLAIVLAGAQSKPVSAMGHYSVRLPVKPVTVGDLCGLEAD